MLVPNQKKEVTVGGKTIKHYKSLGYDVKSRQKIIIPVEHLKETSHEIVQVQCDECSKIFDRSYRNYLELNKKNNSVDLCHACAVGKSLFDKYGVHNMMDVSEWKEKMKKTNLERYGVECVLSSPQIQEKVKNTVLDKYGTDHYSKTEEFKEKCKNTCLEKYGTEYYFSSDDKKEKTIKFYQDKYGVDNCSQVPEIVKKREETNLKKYGAKNVFASEQIKDKIKEHWMNEFGVPYYSQTDEYLEKVKQTCMNKYGVSCSFNLEKVRDACKKYWKDLYDVEYPMQSDDYWINVFYKKIIENGNNKVWTSKPQIEVFNMLQDKGYDVILNYVESKLILDIALFINDMKIDIEYDGWYWHQNKQKDRARDEVLKKLGWRIFRIRSGSKIPDVEDLDNGIKYLLEGHNFTCIVLPDWKEKEESA